LFLKRCDMYYTGQHCESFFNISNENIPQIPLLSTKLIKLKRKLNNRAKKIVDKKL
jgi:hypothetical protein